MGPKLFCITSNKQIRAHFKCYQVKTHVQTARTDPHDLNMDFRSSNSFAHRFYARMHNLKKIWAPRRESLSSGFPLRSY